MLSNLGGSGRATKCRLNLIDDARYPFVETPNIGDADCAIRQGDCIQSDRMSRRFTPTIGVQIEIESLNSNARY